MPERGILVLGSGFPDTINFNALHKARPMSFADVGHLYGIFIDYETKYDMKHGKQSKRNLTV